MAHIRLLAREQTFVHVPYWFIMDYMPKALNGHCKVYLYLLTLYTTSNEAQLPLEDVATKLDMLYSEVIHALQYWDNEGVLSFKSLSTDTFELDFYLEKPVLKTKPPLSKTIIAQSRPEYRTEEINLYIQESPDITQLFKIAEQYLGRLLTITDQKILFSLYDWLHMPFDLIEFLVEYCASNNSTAIHYIEKVAISWIDEGITTVAKAKEKVAFDKKYFKILSTLGSSKNNITLAEKKCIDRWFIDYGLSIEIILEACKRAVMQTNKPSLNYVESILKSWYEAHVKTLDDVVLIDKARESKKQLADQQAYAIKPANKPNKFTNIYSHNWDFEEIEKLEREYVQRKLNGGT